MPARVPYGSWSSPIAAHRLAEASIRLSAPVVDGDDLYWLEGRPREGGRQVVVLAAPGSEPADVFGAGFSARTRVHEYGGGDFTVHQRTVYFSSFGDQRLYRAEPDGVPEPITSMPDGDETVRFADPCVSADGRWICCVRERHLGPGSDQVVNDLVALSADGSSAPVVLAAGRDFYAAPRLSPDGRRLAWFCWDHPQMPWDGTELCVADLDARLRPVSQAVVAGGPSESVTHPVWGPEGELYFASDATGWWNLHVYTDGQTRQVLPPSDVDFARAPWSLGESSFVVLPDRTLACVTSSRGVSRLLRVDPDRATAEEVPLPYTWLASVRAFGEGVVLLGASPSCPTELAVVDVPSGRHTVRRSSSSTAVDPATISLPEAIEFPTEDGRTAHAFFYPPCNPAFSSDPAERPPLLVISHGGPTSAAVPVFDLGIQFWTTRGYAVVDVNYGGSTGFGREYRERLRGAWGVVDVDDCINAARYLVARDSVDANRLVIRGGSAGGYTTLCALTFRPGEFAAGVSYYGVADTAALAADTHKFESHYLDGLLGPYPAAKAVYEQRSPLHHAGQVTSPLLLLQGVEDPVVPVAQAEEMCAALRRNGVPVAYVAFEGEAHGFRRAETITRAAEAELSFIGQVLGTVPADQIEPLEIEGL